LEEPQIHPSRKYYPEDESVEWPTDKSEYHEKENAEGDEPGFSLNEKVKGEAFGVACVLQATVESLQVDGSVQFPNELLSLGAEGVDELNKCTHLLGVAFDLDTQAQLAGAVISDEMKAVSGDEYGESHC
jgi:hypothetical protein